MLKLYATARSANGRKVLAVARELGLAAEVHVVDVYRGEGRSPEYLRINPSGKIPALVEGDFVLTESNAILTYLSDAHGDARLQSRDPKARARIAQWLHFESAHWQPVLSTLLAAVVGHRLFPDRVPAPASAVAWDDERVRPLLAALEASLSAQPFVAGAALSLADFALGGMTTYFRAGAFPFARFPSVAAWYGRLQGLDSWRATADPLWA